MSNIHYSLLIFFSGLIFGSGFRFYFLLKKKIDLVTTKIVRLEIKKDYSFVEDQKYFNIKWLIWFLFLHLPITFIFISLFIFFPVFVLNRYLYNRANFNDIYEICGNYGDMFFIIAFLLGVFLMHILIRKKHS